MFVSKLFRIRAAGRTAEGQSLCSKSGLPSKRSKSIWGDSESSVKNKRREAMSQ